MADKKIALQKTMGEENLYSSGKGANAADAGKETFWGIARAKNPHFKGWATVDSFKKLPNFPENMRGDAELWQDVIEFYDTDFFNPIKFAFIINQDAANELFDNAVNMGVPEAIILTQRSLGLHEDGKMGAITLDTLNKQNPYA